MKSRVGAVAQLLFVDLAGSVAWFPVWWYTKGLQKVVTSSFAALRYRSQSYALTLWIRNFFVPMYGQYDWTGRLVSVFMRTVVIIGRSIALLVEAWVYLLGAVFWVLLPPVSLLLAIRGGILNMIGR
jgi:hypothetical protein